MPTNRTPRRRAGARKRNIKPLAIEAWKAGDYIALHQALGLAPWEASPLPTSVCVLGCHHGERPSWINDAVVNWDQALDLQDRLYEIAGEPGKEMEP
jgi:hypothetical protein